VCVCVWCVHAYCRPICDIGGWLACVRGAGGVTRRLHFRQSEVCQRRANARRAGGRTSECTWLVRRFYEWKFVRIRHCTRSLTEIQNKSACIQCKIRIKTWWNVIICVYMCLYILPCISLCVCVCVCITVHRWKSQGCYHSHWPSHYTSPVHVE